MVLPVLRLCIRRVYVVVGVMLAMAMVMYILPGILTMTFMGKGFVRSHDADHHHFLRAVAENSIGTAIFIGNHGDGGRRDDGVNDVGNDGDNDDDDQEEAADNDNDVDEKEDYKRDRGNIVVGRNIYVGGRNQDIGDGGGRDAGIRHRVRVIDDGKKVNVGDDDGRDAGIRNGVRVIDDGKKVNVGDDGGRDAGIRHGVRVIDDGKKVNVVQSNKNEIVRTEKEIEEIREGLRQLKGQTFDNVKKSVKIIILTYMRSGSTLTGDLFQHHPDVFYMFEPLWRAQKYYNNITQIIAYPNGIKVRKLLTPEDFWAKDSMSTRIIRSVLNCDMERLDLGTLRMGHLATSKCTKPYNECLKIFRRTADAIKDCFPLLQQPCSNSKATVVKTIRYTVDQLENILASDPDVKVIHLFRDPRGTFLSQYRVGEFRNVSKSEKFGKFCNRVLMDLKHSMNLPQKYRDRILNVRYEDITQYPIASAKYMYDFVGLELTNKIKEYIWNITYAGLSKDPKCKMLCTTRANATDTAYKWRKTLPYDAVNMVDSICSKLYGILGYRPFPGPSQYKSIRYPSSVEKFGDRTRLLNVMSLKDLRNMPESNILQFKEEQEV